MKKEIKVLLMCFVLIIQLILIIESNSIVYASSDEEDIFDVILFWGQSNMVGSCYTRQDNVQFIPSDAEQVRAYSELSGISEDILRKNSPTVRNYVSIEQIIGTVYEYKYLNNDLEEIKAETKTCGENLIYDTNENKLVKPEDNGKRSLSESKGTNLIPEFCRAYYERTGHKVIAISAAREGKPIRQFLPYDDDDNDVDNDASSEKEDLRLYESIVEKYTKAMQYLNSNNYNIGRKIYIVFQGESDVGSTVDNTNKDYYKQFMKVHNNLKQDLGIDKGVIIETAREAGTNNYKLDAVNTIHEAQEKIVNYNSDIILGSSFPYDMYIPAQEEYDRCKNRVAFDSNGNKLEYNKALEKARSCEDYDENNNNAVHFTSASLCQIGREVAYKLDDVPPRLNVQYSTTAPTNQKVTVTIKSNEPVKNIDGWSISSDKKELTKEYTENNTEDITLCDFSGNTKKVNVSVTNIDKKAPQWEIEYSTTALTNQNVIVTVTANEKIMEIEGWTISNNRRVLTKEYTENNTEDIILCDLAGNTKRVNISVTNIDKKAPQLDVQYSTTTVTNQNVTVTIIASEKVREIEGWTISNNKRVLTKEYTQNNTEDVTLCDLAGNTKKVNVSVTNIDKKAPQLNVQYSTTSVTNKDVTVTITANEKIQEVDGWTRSNNKRALTKVYTVNCTESITVYDLAGNQSEIVNIIINQIDKNIPNIEVKYSTTEKTNQDVQVSLVSDKPVRQIEGWQISEDERTLTKVYSENTIEEIVVYDIIGNKSRNLKIVIENIDKVKPKINIKYSIATITNRDVVVTISSNESLRAIEGWTLLEDGNVLTKRYLENAKEDIRVFDLAGNYENVSISIENIDKIAPNINTKYSTTTKTNKDVTVVLDSNEQIQEVEGWKISEDRKQLTKTFEKNSSEDIVIKDLAGNEVNVKIKVNNIDKTAPKIDVQYKLSDDKSQIMVIITSNEELQPMEGWVLSEDGKMLTKVFSKDEKDEILVYDLAGNCLKLDLNLANIEENKEFDNEDKNIKDMNKENEGDSSSNSKKDEINAQDDKSKATQILPKTGLTRIIIVLIFVLVGVLLYTYNKDKKLNI